MSKFFAFGTIILLLLVGEVVAAPQFGVDYYSDRFLICFRPHVGEVRLEDGLTTGFASIDKLIQTYEVTSVKRWLPRARDIDHAGDIYLSRIYRVQLASKHAEVEEVIRAFDEDAHLLYAEPEGIMRPCVTPNDPRYSQEWHLPQVQAALAWDLWSARGGVPGDPSIVIGIVDTGVDWDHPDLVGNLWQNQGEDVDGDGHTIELTDSGWAFDQGDLNGVDDDVNGYEDDLIGWDPAGFEAGVDPDNDPDGPPLGQEVVMHGTHCSGIASAVTDNGVGVASVAWQVRIMSVKATYDNDPDVHVSNGYDGILYAAHAGADIISCSWGGYGGSSNCATVQIAHDTYGSVVFCGAGNDNSTDLFYPAACQSAISVAATTFGDQRASFSNYGSTIDVAAPGEQIWSTVYSGGYRAWGGTSMACPLAASVFGLLKSMFPDSGNAWLEREFKEGCDSIDSVNQGFEGQLGAGRVNAYKPIARNLFPHLQFFSQCVQEVEGDGDGVIEPGEIARLIVTLENEEGWLDATDVEAFLRSLDERVEITDSTSSYQDIPDGVVRFNLMDPFYFSVIQDLKTDPWTIPMEMEVLANLDRDWPYRVWISLSVEVTPPGVEEGSVEASTPERFWLAHNAPNPFNAQTVISFNVPVDSDVELKVYNLEGDVVRVLASGREESGLHAILWNGRNESGEEVASGVYLCRLSAGAFSATRKLLLLR